MKVLIAGILLIALVYSAAAYTLSANTVGFKLETNSEAGSNIAIASIHDSSGVDQDSFVLNGDDLDKLNVDLAPDYSWIWTYDDCYFNTGTLETSTLYSTSRGGITQQSESNTILQGEGIISLGQWSELNDQDSGTTSSGHRTDIGGYGGIWGNIYGGAQLNSRATVIDSTGDTPTVSMAGVSAQLVHAEPTGFGYLESDQEAVTSADEVLGAVASQNVYADAEGSTQDPDALAVNENSAPTYSYVNAFSQDTQGSTHTDAFVANGRMGFVGEGYAPVYQAAAAGSISENYGIQRSISGFDPIDMPNSYAPWYYVGGESDYILLSGYGFWLPTDATSGSVAAGFYEYADVFDNFNSVIEGPQLLSGNYARVGANVYNANVPSGLPVINPFVGGGSLGAYSIAYQGKVGTDYGFGVLGLPVASWGDV